MVPSADLVNSRTETAFFLILNSTDRGGERNCSHAAAEDARRGKIVLSEC